MDHAARCPQRGERCDAKFGQFFEEKLRSIAARQGSGDIQAKRQLASRAFDGEYLQRYLAAADFLDACGILMPVAVEQTNGVAGAKPANHGKMMCLGALDKHRTRFQLTIDVESLGHPC